MDKIAKAISEGQLAYYATSGDLSKAESGYKTKCMQDAWQRGWNRQKYVDKNLFIFLKRVGE